jgi:hypothetical protein
MTLARFLMDSSCRAESLWSLSSGDGCPLPGDFPSFWQVIAEYESRCEQEHGYFRPIIREVVKHYLGCGDPRSGFARIHSPNWRAEHLLTSSFPLGSQPIIHLTAGIHEYILTSGLF